MSIKNWFMKEVKKKKPVRKDSKEWRERERKFLDRCLIIFLIQVIIISLIVLVFLIHSNILPLDFFLIPSATSLAVITLFFVLIVLIFNLISYILWWIFWIKILIIQAKYERWIWFVFTLLFSAVGIWFYFSDYRKYLSGNKEIVKQYELRKKLGRNPLKCDICGQKLTTLKDVEVHKKEYHSKK